MTSEQLTTTEVTHDLGGGKLPRHIAVVDLGFGDSGKGTTVDYLTSPNGPLPAGEVEVEVVRFNGGTQAAHNVTRPGGLHHTFAQFGSGTLNGARTHLSRYTLVEPLALGREALKLKDKGVPDPLSLVTVERTALITTPIHALVNKGRETARGAGAHGSCGRGIGDTMISAIADPYMAIRVEDCLSPTRLRNRLLHLISYYRDTKAPFDADEAKAQVDSTVEAYLAFSQSVDIVDEEYLLNALETNRVIFENAQGVLLDEWRGFHPHTTWSTTTFDNVEDLLAGSSRLLPVSSAEVPRGVRSEDLLRLGVVRSYTTRHGKGPLVGEDESLGERMREQYNTTGKWQGPFRAAPLDLVLLRYALDTCGGVDAMVVTHMDKVEETWRVTESWEHPTGPVNRLDLGPWMNLVYQEELKNLAGQSKAVVRETKDILEDVEKVAGVPVIIESWGVTYEDKRARVPAALTAVTV